MATQLIQRTVRGDGSIELVRINVASEPADIHAKAALKDNTGASTNPGASDDSTGGYAVGSIWVNTTSNEAFVCVDATAAAAIWTSVTAAGGGGLPVADTTAVVKGSADATKLVRIEADGLATATTRVITMPDKDVTLDDLNDSRPIRTFFASATGDTTTTSASDGLVNSMSVTPGAGTYTAIFTGSVEIDSGGETVEMNLYVNGVLDADSERRMAAAQADSSMPFACVGRGLVLSAAQSIQGRWRASGGQTATMHERNLLLIEEP